MYYKSVIMITEQDTFDTLKYGYVPLDHLMEHAKIKFMNFDDFILDEDDQYYRYPIHISLYYDGEFYDIDCMIRPPYDDGIDDCYQYVTVQFYCGLAHSETTDLPYFNHQDVSIYEIKSREQFIEVLEYDWKDFVQHSIGRILTHRMEILNNLDNIVKANKNCNKKDYIKVMDIVAKHVIDNIQNMIDFKQVKDWTEK